MEPTDSLEPGCGHGTDVLITSNEQITGTTRVRVVFSAIAWTACEKIIVVYMYECEYVECVYHT